ncbi:esterase [Citrobacter sp. JGM124]|uniref:esterase n=1 Tax=Citrobacter sp. JGM124 TaxID=2799789 RepID=UPI001BA8829D|nr:esterase [Citrobacter sp. JGM124]MBS0848603.1 esterase [Citrobacter sp. JGM124]
MKLNARLQTAQQSNNNYPIVLIHGLFGSLDNLGILARDLSQTYTLLQVDLRNHGLSPRSDEMNYPAMAADILDTLDAAGMDKVIIIGHSMGGKVAMALTALAPERVEKLVIIDIAPVAYSEHRHREIFTALHAVTEAGATTRPQATEIMKRYISEAEVIQFLLKSFHQGEWRFNVPVLEARYENIIGWQPVPAWPHPILFIRGGNSPYIEERYRDELLKQFPQSQAYVVSGAGHWVHAEKPDAVLRVIHRFLGAATQG